MLAPLAVTALGTATAAGPAPLAAARPLGPCGVAAGLVAVGILAVGSLRVTAAVTSGSSRTLLASVAALASSAGLAPSTVAV